ncbi:putative bifunctional diguanylate cyclase/phosphodiesterase [Geodermatophilus marinus]|uniref:putative bifunctional diguanylate cyclase/phosphodiesterase n=1 Tax=Geodermatophilus sp. LHW52908 TaxID=2303986 RepID=UPI000E3E86EA|nr:EAL domain-containing protein [Geodermatophilus sp. LHW52908]RFU20834.1 EAL domain-containing protein [Geodermatophilus sp. LHW52908]
MGGSARLGTADRRGAAQAGGGTVAVLVGLLVVLVGYPVLDGLVADVVYLGVVWAAAAMAWWAVQRQGTPPGTALVAVGVSLNATGESFWVLQDWVGAAPTVSAADGAYLAGYVALGAGIWRTASSRGRGRPEQVDGWLDGAAVFVAAFLLAWQFSVGALVADDALHPFTRLVWALYPALDAALIGLVLRLLATRARGDRAALALTAGAACWLASDTAYLLLADADPMSTWLDTGWLCGALLIAAATRHRAPAGTDPADRPLGTGRLAISMGTLLVPAGLHLVDDRVGAGGTHASMVGGTLLLTLIVFVRTTRLLRAESAARALVASQQRYGAALARHSSDAVVVLDERGRPLSCPSSPGGLEPGAGTSAEELLGLTGVDPAQARVVFDRALAAGGSVVAAELPCRRDGVDRWVAVRLVDLRTDPDVGGVVVHVTDITDRKRAEAALAHQAFHDPLTGLANRALFTDRVEQALRRRRRSSSAPAVVFVDLDRFKAVNDTLGHAAGDALLVEVAGRLRGAVRAGDTVARLGGDEFAVLAELTSGAPGEAEAAAGRVLEALRHPAVVAGHQVPVSASVGVVVAADGADADSLVRDADTAMYEAKVAGRGRLALFDPAMRAATVERRLLEQELRGALEGGQLRLVHQPVVDLADGRVVGFEALLRWNSPVLGPVPPARFVPVAEELGLIGAIGEWVLHEACRTAAAWRREHPAAAGLTMAVNLSAVQLTSPGLLGSVRAALAGSGLPPEALVLEVTETALVQDAARAAGSLAGLRELGVRLALDDFGTGYSSLQHLQRFTVDVLKIDRSFVAELPEDGGLPPLLRGLLELGRALGLEVLAEGVETEAQRRALARSGCDSAQGYLFARPLETTDAELLLLGQPATAPRL